MSKQESIYVLYRGTLGDAGDPVVHTSPLLLEGPPGMQDLTLEAGVTKLEAATFEGHKSGAALARRIDAGEVRSFDSVRKILDLPLADLRSAIAVTRHGVALRELLAAEQDSTRPRGQILEQLEKRIGLFRHHAPVVIDLVRVPKPTEGAEANEDKPAKGKAAKAG